MRGKLTERWWLWLTGWADMVSGLACVLTFGCVTLTGFVLRVQSRYLDHAWPVEPDPFASPDMGGAGGSGGDGER